MNNRRNEEDKKVILTIKSLIDHCNYVYEKSIVFKNKDNFLAADEMYRDGCTFNLGHIGEQSNDIPKTLRDKYNHIPWKNIIGQRNILFHHYGKIRYDKVWDSIVDNIPEYRDELIQILLNEYHITYPNSESYESEKKVLIQNQIEEALKKQSVK